MSDQGHPVFVVRVDGPGSVRFHTPLGQRELTYASAAGKAILSAMDEEGIRRMCAETGLAARTAHTITDVGRLLDNLAMARRLGFAVDDEEDAEGVFCVGAAFFGHDGSCAGAVSVTGIKGDLPAWRINELGRTVRRYADQVSGMLGGSPCTGPGLAAAEWVPAEPPPPERRAGEHRAGPHPAGEDRSGERPAERPPAVAQPR